jgi:hypothetical protein
LSFLGLHGIPIQNLPFLNHSQNGNRILLAANVISDALSVAAGQLVLFVLQVEYTLRLICWFFGFKVNKRLFAKKMIKHGI